MSLFKFPRTVYFQRDIFDSLGDILLKDDIRKVLIVTDKNVLNLIQDRMEKALEKLDKELLTDVMPEPTITQIQQALSNLKGRFFDAIIAIGGGSVIDFSKAIAVLLSDSNSDLRSISPFENIRLKMKLIAIPTTSGTGSDVSFGVVLSEEEGKLAMGNYELVPEIDILDSSLTPIDKKIIVSTGIDAFVHSFEAIASNTSNLFTDALAEKAISTIYHNLERAMENEEEAKDLMHISATMAGMAFSNSGTASAHALGHSLGATFHVTHGTSVGLFLIPSIIFNSQDPETKKKYVRIGKILNVNDFESLTKEIERFYKKVGQPCRVRELGIDEREYVSKMEQLVYLSMRDSELAFNPVIAGEDDLRRIFVESY